MSGVKVVVFDIGGVLVKSHSEWDRVGGPFWNDEFGTLKLKELLETGKISEDEFMEKTLKNFDSNVNYFEEAVLKTIKHYDIVLEVFEVFKKIKKPVYIFSDTNPLHMKYLLSKFPKIFKIPKKLFLSYEIKMKKKDKGSFEFLLKKLKAKGNEVLFVDDKKELCERAEKLGIKTINFDNSKDKVSKLKRELEKFKVL